MLSMLQGSSNLNFKEKEDLEVDRRESQWGSLVTRSVLIKWSRATQI